MKKRIRLFSYILLISFATLCTPKMSFAIDDAIVAIVNDEVITLKDLKDYINTTYVNLLTQGMPKSRIDAIMKELDKNGLMKIVEDKLLLSESKEMGLDVKKEAIDAELQKTIKKYNTKEEFMAALAANGTTITELRKKIENQLKIRFVIDHKIKSKIYVNPQEVTDYYNQNLERFRQTEKVDLSSIYIAYTTDKTAAKERIATVVALLKSGKSFNEVATQYSDTPSIGIVEKGQLTQNIENVVFRLKEGEVSSEIDVGAGVYIFKLNQKIPEKIASLDDSKDNVYNYLYRQKFHSKLQQWIDELKGDAFIEIK